MFRARNGARCFSARAPEIARLLAALACLAAAPASADPGIVAGWGDNQSSSLGDGTTINRTAPVRIGAVQLQSISLIQVAAGDAHGCALEARTSIYCWGLNNRGQIGDGTTTGRSTPTSVFAAGASHVSANANTTCAVLRGAVNCWGQNFSGQIGDGTLTNRKTPTAVSTSGVLSGKTATTVAVGSQHSCALISDGAVACWGDGSHGQLGNGATGSSTTPVAVSTGGALAGKRVTQIMAGRFHTCALTSDGLAYCWGYNFYGQLGDGTTTDRSAPTAVSTSGALAGKSLVQIATWSDHTCAIASDGAAYCWGLGSSGQIGDGATTDRSVPTAVAASGALAGKIVTQMATGANNSCALTSDGLAFCWGLGSSGQIGDGASTQRTSPTAVDASGALAGQFLSSIALGTNFALVAAPPCGTGAPIATGTGSNALWTRVALPCNNYDTADTQIATVFGQFSVNSLIDSEYNTANPSAGAGWAVYRHDAATNAYVLLSLTDSLQRGTGYWMKSYQKPDPGKLVVPGQNVATTPITAPVTQAQGCASANGCFAIPVTAVSGTSRYNLLGNPFPWNVDWSQARVRIDGSAATYTPSQAATANILANTFWMWNGTSYDTYSDVAPNIGNLPYMGSFWVQALAGGAGHTVELLVPKLATTRP